MVTLVNDWRVGQMRARSPRTSESARFVQLCANALGSQFGGRRENRRADHHRAPRITVGAGNRVGPAWSQGFRAAVRSRINTRSEEHTSELQSLTNLVCRLLL